MKIDKKLIKVLIPGLVFLIVLFSLFFISNNSKVINSLAKLFYEEVELDNWEISTVFYDSTVNNGQTPLTEINWDASDGGYGDGEEKTIIIQINYKNTNTVTNYAPGDLKITIDNLNYNTNDYQLTTTVVAGVNDQDHSGYDWDFVKQRIGGYNYNYPSVKMEKLYFTNATLIEQYSNLEGSIQVKYTFKPKSHYEQGDSSNFSFNRTIKANLSDSINCNDLLFNYNRTYIHPWEKSDYSIKMNSNKINSYDGLVDNPANYYWVKYSYTVSQLHGTTFSRNTYPYSMVNNLYINQSFPSDCVVLNKDFEVLTSDDNNYVLSATWGEYFDRWHVSDFIFYVGYPKSNYNSNNSTINASATLRGIYDDSDEKVFLDDDTIELNIMNYDYNYPDKLYNNYKYIYEPTYADSNEIEQLPLYYDSINGDDENVGSGGYFLSAIASSFVYTGTAMDVIFGDDLLYITDSNNEYRRLLDNEYYFDTIYFPVELYNGNLEAIPSNKYDCELYVRKANQSFEKIDDFKNLGNKSWSFNSDDKVVGYYFIVKSAKESLHFSPKSAITSSFASYKKSMKKSSRIKIRSDNSNIATEGSIVNLSFLQVKKNNSLVNISNEEGDKFLSFSKKDDVIDYDDETHNGNTLRTFDTINYSQFSLNTYDIELANSSDMSTFSQDIEKEKFFGTRSLSLYFETPSPNTVYEIENYASQFDQSMKVNGIEMYSILPKGMYVESSPQEAIDLITTGQNFNRTDIFKSNGYHFNGSEWIPYVKDHTSVEIIKDYNNTGQDMIKVVVDFSDSPIIFRQPIYWMISYVIVLKYKYSVSYDDYVEYGKNWETSTYTKYYNTDSSSRCILSGSKTKMDFDGDGIESDYLYSRANANINYVISTNQDVQVTVRDNDGNYDTGKVDIKNNSNYYYKLRARTGSSDITNLVIYDSLEKYAKDTNMEFFDPSRGYTKWYGEFLGVDTTNAESKGYTIKTYYSEKDEPGDLKTDNSWKVYTDSVDKTKVKSLAFEYLDSNGNPAVIPANSITYILIKMKSPSDEGIKTLAYNGCWTEWNAIDSITGEAVDFITGINSNVVKVALPNSVEPTDIDLTIDKYWNDSNNKLNIRPNTTTIQVVPDGDLSKAIDVPLGSTNIDSNNSNHWYTTITVPKYDLDSNLIDYTLREDEIILEDGYKYTPLIDGNSITNTLTKEIELKKIWKDNTNSYLTRPNSVTYNVKQNGNNYKEVTFTGTYNINQWTKTITVPVYDSSNREYNYSIEEVNISNYSSTCSGFVCTNILTGKDNINVNKEWIDNNNTYNTRPDNITIHLLRNNNQYLDVILNQDNSWNSDVEVDKYDSNGVKYTYTVSEDEVEEYGLVSYNQNSYKVTNTLKTNMNIVITKKWIDDNNSNNTRPNELVVTLLRNGEEYREITLSGNTDTWTSTVEVPKYDDNQRKYQYSIKEITDGVNEDYSDITYDNLTITNKLSKNTNLTITKKWEDNNNKYFTRPDEVNIELFRDNELYKTIQLDGNDNTWKKTVEDVPVYDENGRKYSYSIRENNISRYEKVTYDQTKLEVTNELTDVPTVTLYFTVVNGYVDPNTGEIKYDEFGLNEILKKYNVSADDEYIFNFELENVDTHKTYDGKLSTKFVLEFKDIPYGKYKVMVGKDKLFEFVDMFSIEDVNGVSFKKLNNEMYISIEPTGDNIIYGAKIVNKINLPIENPKTGRNIVITIVVLLALAIVSNRIVKKVLNKA